jgi:hypothetical protein
MQAHLKDLNAAFHVRPFGDPMAVAKAARQTAVWTDDLLAQLQKTRFDRPALQHLLIGLGRSARADLDFDSARQLSWAARVIHSEFHPGIKDEEGEALFRTLDKQLQLDLPKGQVEIGKEYLPEALRSLSEHEPERFQQTFGTLIRQLEKRFK